MRKTLLAVFIVLAVAALALPVFARGGFGCRGGGCGPGWQAVKTGAPEARFNCGGPCGQTNAQDAKGQGAQEGADRWQNCRPDCPNVPGAVAPENDGAAK